MELKPVSWSINRLPIYPVFLLLFAFAVTLFSPPIHATNLSRRVLVFYTDKGEPDHIEFARQALRFLDKLAKREHFQVDSTTDWKEMNPRNLKTAGLVIWLNDFAVTSEARAAFEQYMEHGGAWLGFHVSAYNDAETNWAWFVKFLGGSVFYGNNWPPLTARLIVDAPGHPVTKHLPEAFPAPSNEWYIWKPSPRDNPDVKVLVTLDPKNYPIGLKDTITSGDLPVVWTNTRYHMVYINMGHGDKIFTSETQNTMFADVLMWLMLQN